jgi:hypothetical protein
MATVSGSPSSGMEALRPLELGELLDRAFSLYRRRFALFAMIVAVPNVLLFLFTSTMTWFNGPKDAAVVGTPGAVFTPLVLVGILLGVIFYLFAIGASQAASVFAVSETYLGRPATVAGAYRHARGRILVLIGVVIYMSLAAGAAALLLIVPGIIVMWRSSVAIPAAMLEDLGPRAAFERSWTLTKGFAWRAGTIVFLGVIIVIVAELIFQWPFQLLATALKDTPAAAVLNVFSGLGGLLAGILAGPIALIATTIFYYDLRVRKEGFDLQQLVASLGDSGPAGSLTPGPLGMIR